MKLEFFEDFEGSGGRRGEGLVGEFVFVEEEFNFEGRFLRFEGVRGDLSFGFY